MVTKNKLTLDQFLALPEEKPALEFVDGEVIQKPLPDFFHSTIQGVIIELLSPQLLTRGFYILPEWRNTFTVAARSYVPDLGIIDTRRVPVDASGDFLNDAHLVPDVAIEILSPGQSAGPLLNKLSFYLSNGAQLGILIDARQKLVTVVRQGEEPATAVGTVSLDPAVPGVNLDLAAMFARLRGR